MTWDRPGSCCTASSDHRTLDWGQPKHEEVEGTTILSESFPPHLSFFSQESMSQSSLFAVQAEFWTRRDQRPTAHAARRSLQRTAHRGPAPRRATRKRSAFAKLCNGVPPPLVQLQATSGFHAEKKSHPGSDQVQTGRVASGIEWSRNIEGFKSGTVDAGHGQKVSLSSHPCSSPQMCTRS